MAVPTNLHEKYDAAGLAEDVTDVIHNISPTETPLVSMVPSTDASAVYHQWQTDVLAAPASNAQIEGDDLALTAPTATVMVGNHTQITAKAFGISGTLERVKKYGRDSELALQAAKTARELKTHVDFHITGTNTASSAGTSGDGGGGSARLSGSLETWLDTNTNFGGTGADGGFSGTTTAARMDGTTRVLALSYVDLVIESAWSNGGNPSVLLMGPKMKTKFSTLDGVGARRENAAERTITATADLYVSNFGELRIVPSRHIRKQASIDHAIFAIDPEYLKIAYLRPWQQFDLAKTGDSVKREMLVEWTLEVCNEKAHGGVFDLKDA